eukprot:c47192_g1_i1 orf=130-2094(+)
MSSDNLQGNRANGGGAGSLSSSFTSVLEEIFVQTQKEIRECRASMSTRSSVSPFPATNHVVPLNETERFEPLLDPALSYISKILTEEDCETDRPYLTLNEFVACETTAREFAALLNEDSRSLSLKLEPENPGSSTVPPTLDMDCRLCLGTLDEPGMFASMGPSSNSVSDASLHDVYAVDWLGRPCMNSIERTTHVRNSFQCEEMIGDAEGNQTESKNDVVVRSNIQRSQKTHIKETFLKPRKESTGSRKRSGSKMRAGKEGEKEFLNLNDLLLQSAQAVGVNDVKRAVQILTKVKQYSSPYGNGAERLAHYFVEALEARFSGIGWPLYLGHLRPRPSPAAVLKATALYIASCPFNKVLHYFINQSILDAAKGASTLHIMDLQIAGGFNYPSLIKALAARPGGPPFLRVLGIEFPHYSMMPAQIETVLEGLQKTGRRLSDYAAQYGVPFEFIAWAGLRESLEMQDFVSRDRNKSEVLIIISAYLLRYVMDETLDSPSARFRLLKMGQSVNPNVYIQGVVTGAYNTPYFTRRFREALFHFESLFDVLDTFIERENQDRIVFESELLGKAILNVVACEGTEVVERIDKYKHWKVISEEAGFEQLPLNEVIKQNVQTMLESWDKEYNVTEDSQYMLMGWKGRMLHALSTWKTSPLGTE